MLNENIKMYKIVVSIMQSSYLNDADKYRHYMQSTYKNLKKKFCICARTYVEMAVPVTMAAMAVATSTIVKCTPSGKCKK